MLKIKKIFICFILTIGLLNLCFGLQPNNTHKLKNSTKNSNSVKFKKNSNFKKSKTIHYKKNTLKKNKINHKKNNQPKIKVMTHSAKIKTVKPKSAEYYKKIFTAQKTQPINPPIGLVNSIEQRLVEFVKKTISTLRYSSYKLGGSYFDTRKGVYIVDCSRYIDHSLSHVYPNAYSSLVNYTGANKPNSLNYYNFFRSLSEDSNDYWSKVDHVRQLRPGDILVFRYNNHRGNATHGQGHVMVVMDKPIPTKDAFLLSVADSAPSRHSDDTRSKYDSGIGIGTLLLKVHPKTGKPYAYAWSIGSRWKNNVNFAMGRPLEIGY